MKRRPKLSATMSLAQFDNGYWYATQLRQFAQRLGIPSPTRLRKDELEHAIKEFLRSGTIVDSARRAPRASDRATPRDSELGLRLSRRIVRYTNDRATKTFLTREAKRLDPAFRRRSGAMYRLNRWREQQLAAGAAPTYRDLVMEYLRLSRSTEPFARIPHGRYINFVSDFMAQRPGAARSDVVAAWKALKTMDCPKTYDAWAIHSRTEPSS